MTDQWRHDLDALAAGRHVDPARRSGKLDTLVNVAAGAVLDGRTYDIACGDPDQAVEFRRRVDARVAEIRAAVDELTRGAADG